MKNLKNFKQLTIQYFHRQFSALSLQQFFSWNFYRKKNLTFSRSKSSIVYALHQGAESTRRTFTHSDNLCSFSEFSCQKWLKTEKFSFMLKLTNDLSNSCPIVKLELSYQSNVMSEGCWFSKSSPFTRFLQKSCFIASLVICATVMIISSWGIALI